MTLPIRALPLLQQWDCHSCSDCCRSYVVRVSDEERDAILKQGWMGQEFLGTAEPILREPKTGAYRLAHQQDGSCVFLDEQNRCRIHARFGESAKPLACRVYPFVLVPAGEHWRVGIRFACPSACGNMGQPLESHTPLLQTFADQLEAELPSTHIQPPELRKGATLAWPGLIRLTRAFVDILTTSDVPLELRLRRMVTLARACRDANLHQLDLPKLSEFLTIMTAVAEESTSLEKLPSPSWVTRMLFRQQLALYARKDKGRHAGDAPKSRWFRWQSAWRFARWKGLIPRLHAAIPAVRFQDVEAVQITPNRATWETLERYYVVKLVSFQFFGPMNFHRHYFDGLDSLLLTFPAIGWLARIFAWSHERSPDDAVSLALQAVDDNFGFHPLLGASWQTWANRTITERGDLARLIAWYAPQQIPRS